MAKVWDNILKSLARENPQAFVSLVLKGAQFTELVERELIAKSLEADVLYIVVWKGERVVLHIEFQRKKDNDMGRRVWQYNMLADYLTGIPVISIVIYLVRDGEVEQPPYVRTLPDNQVVHLLHYWNLCLWDVETEALKVPGLEELLPLLPLTKSGKRLEVVDEMIACLQAAGRHDLLAISYTIAAKVFPESKQAGVKARFKAMSILFDDNWAVEEFVEKGRLEGKREGKLEGMREDLCAYIEIRFPELLSLAKERTQRSKSQEKVKNALIALYKAQSVEDAREILTQLSTRTRSQKEITS